MAWTHPDVLEEPGAHDVGGVLGQDAALVLGGAVVVVEEVEVLVELQLQLQQHNNNNKPSGEAVHSGNTTHLYAIPDEATERGGVG